MAKWIIGICVLGLLLTTTYFFNHTKDRSIKDNQNSKKPESSYNVKIGTLDPGRILSLKTNRGLIEIILLEKDCPVTTKQIADLAAAGKYDGVEFGRVEDYVIQTQEAKQNAPKLGLELFRLDENVINAKGAVGMAREKNDPNSATSAFYILRDPQPILDGDYTVFGKIIKGMDAVLVMKKGDKILKASVRNSTKKDKDQYMEILKIEARRKVE